MIFLNSIASISTLGNSDADAIKTLKLNKSDLLTKTKGYLPHSLEAYLGYLNYELPLIENENCRNNRLVLDCISRLKVSIESLIEKYSSDRIGIVVGTSTSAITDVEDEALISSTLGAEKFFYDFKLYEIGNISEFLKRYFKITGPCYTISTACTSSSKAIISAAELVNSGVCDVVIACGSDSLSRISVSGFYALGALSLEQCRPFAANRCGINIAEGAAVTIVAKDQLCDDSIKLLGYGQTSDGHHISAPEPQGVQGIEAVKQALAMAKLKPSDIGYVNMHGTGTKLNDSMEGNIIRSIFGASTPISSTKHITGHTLGAAGIVEAYIAKLILQNELYLPYHNYSRDELDSEFYDLNILLSDGYELAKPYIMSNNFAFGGNNTSLILGS